MMRIFAVALGALAVVSPVAADEYWIAYEGNDFPENVGWERIVRGGGADRWIEQGTLVIDSTASTGIVDAYKWSGLADPEAGELFVAEWRVRLDRFIRSYDAVVTIARGNTPGHVSFELAEDHVLVRREWERIDVAPFEWHSYRLESTDMQTYELFVDDVPRFYGAFESQSFLQSFLAFGDEVLGAASLSRWDYVRFGVVPEPATISMASVMCLIVLRRR